MQSKHAETGKLDPEDIPINAHLEGIYPYCADWIARVQTGWQEIGNTVEHPPTTCNTACCIWQNAHVDAVHNMGTYQK